MVAVGRFDYLARKAARAPGRPEFARLDLRGRVPAREGGAKRICTLSPGGEYKREKGSNRLADTSGSLGTTAYARLDRCSKVGEEWAAESMAGVAMRRSRRASACRRGSTPSECRNGGAQKRNFWTPSASCFPARSRADPKGLEGRYADRSRRTGGPCLARTCRDLYCRSRCRGRPNLGKVLDWQHLPALHERSRRDRLAGSRGAQRTP